jgi:TfoX/Sxy family transcriptional regulator of competence genes
MAFAQDLADRLREVVAGESGVSEQRMFGGLAFLINGNMGVSASGQGGLLLRIDPQATQAMLNPPIVRRFEMRGREMDGWLRIADEAVDTEDRLRQWVRVGVEYARSLPAK